MRKRNKFTFSEYIMGALILLILLTGGFALPMYLVSLVYEQYALSLEFLFTVIGGSYCMINMYEYIKWLFGGGK